MVVVVGNGVVGVCEWEVSVVLRCCVVLKLLIGCLSFTSWQYLRSYQDGYRLVIAPTYDDFTVLPICH